MDPYLFDTITKMAGSLKRNIIYITDPKRAFASLLDENDDLEIPQIASEAARAAVAYDGKFNDFYYTTAIEYPFKTKPIMNTRFSDGTYPVWYGSKDLETTIYETVYHSGKYLFAIEGINITEKIIRRRNIFNVYCDALLIDLVGKEKNYPELKSDDYGFTQKLGKEVSEGGYPGILTPSARHQGGINANIFKQEILNEPQLLASLQYEIDLENKSVMVLGFETELKINF